jgi:hypothetical protein
MNVDNQIKLNILQELIDGVEIEKTRLNFLKLNKFKELVGCKNIKIFVDKFIEKNNLIDESAIPDEEKINLQIEKYLKDVIIHPCISANKLTILLVKEAMKLFLNFTLRDFIEGINLYEGENYQYDALYDYSDSEENESNWATDNKPVFINKF